MLTAMETVNCLARLADKTAVWNVNTEEEYAKEK